MNKINHIAIIVCVFMMGCSTTQEPAPVETVDTRASAKRYEKSDYNVYDRNYTKPKKKKAQSRFEFLPGEPSSAPQTHSAPKPQQQDNSFQPRSFTPEEAKPANKPALNGAWIWPHQGRIIKGYTQQGTNANKGIDIAGELGSPVFASRSGKVVYSGTGLRDYGQLIIIKHDNTFLSAYAHNQQLLVKEGDSVTQGQTIARMGNSGTDQTKLHFEIRKNGKPIDPLNFLTKT